MEGCREGDLGLKGERGRREKREVGGGWSS